MENGCKKFLVFLGVALYFLIWGAEGKILRYPYSCYPMRYKFNYRNLILQPTGKYHPQTIYFIHNVSKQAISLFQARSNDELYIIISIPS